MKIDLRRKAKEIRKTLPIQEISMELVELVRKSNFYKEAKSVMIFYPKTYEIDLRDLLNDDKNFYLPRVNGKFLDVCPYEKDDELKLSEFKVYEPMTECVSPLDLDLIIVPALLVDANNYRLGYGGGYYDRLLEIVNEKVRTMCVMPKELLIDKLPIEDFDVKIDKIIITQ